MSSKISAVIAAVVTIVAVIGIIVLAALGDTVPVTLYAFASLGFGGHLALTQPASTDAVTNALAASLEAVKGITAYLDHSASIASASSPASPFVKAPAWSTAGSSVASSAASPVAAAPAAAPPTVPTPVQA